MGAGPGPDCTFESSASPSKGRFKFKLGVGPGDFELDVTGRDFTLFFFAEAIGAFHLRAETVRECKKEG